MNNVCKEYLVCVAFLWALLAIITLLFYLLVKHTFIMFCIFILFGLPFIIYESHLGKAILKGWKVSQGHHDD
jgi:hypothetical protein